jgi:hypothetical protein
VRGGRVVAASSSVVLAVALLSGAASAGTPLPPPPNAYLSPGGYADIPLVSFTARDPQPLYDDALRQACAKSQQIDAAAGTAQSNGNGVLLGTSNGATVVSEDILSFGTAKQLASYVNLARSSPACVAYASRGTLDRIYVQYPQTPPLPTLGPLVERTDDRFKGAFTGTTMSDPQASGAVALLRDGNHLIHLAFRTANQPPEQVVPLRDSLQSSAWYALAAATGAGADPELQADADQKAERLKALEAWARFAMQATTRTTFPANPPSCDAATDAYVFSGVESALREFAGQDPAARVGVRTQLSVFPTAEDATRYLVYGNDLTNCFRDLYAQNLPAGSKVAVERIPKKGTAKDGKARTVQYVSTFTGPDGAVLGQVGIELSARVQDALYLFVQRASADPTFDVQAELDKLHDEIMPVLAAANR